MNGQWKFRRLFLIFCFMLISFERPLFAEWNVSTVHSMSEMCNIREALVDETKLTLKFDSFSIKNPSRIDSFFASEETCSMGVVFILPANHRLKTLTHRIFSHGSKDHLSQISLSASVQVGNQWYRQIGTLVFGTVFNGRLLLYRSFDLRGISDCQSYKQEFEVKGEWLLDVKAEPRAQQGILDLAGEQDWIDLWLEAERC